MQILQKKKKHISILICIILSLILIISLSISFNKKTCTFIEKGKNLVYPSFIINFNITLMQANYVEYTIIDTENNCFKCMIRNDSNTILQMKDFLNLTVIPSFLVPVEYSYDAYIMTNVIPIKIEHFQQWRNKENYIKEKFLGKKIIKGCLTNGEYLISYLGNKIYLPSVCHYYIFDNRNIIASTSLYFTENFNNEDPEWFIC